MTANLLEKFDQGLTPNQFVEKMTKNQEQFKDWYQQFTWQDTTQQAFFEHETPTGIRCLAIAADWCGDVVRNLPVVFRLIETAKIPMRVLVMEEHLDVMDQFLTMGGRSIPVVLFLNDAGDVIGRWGPRPTYVQEPMVKFKQENTDKDAPDYQDKLTETRQEIRRRYGTGTTYQSLIVNEIQEILNHL